MIGVFAGTSDGKAIVNKLLDKNHRVVVFNGSKAGADMFKAHDHLIITEEKLSFDQLKEAVEFYDIKIIVDATHPYAQEITKNLLSLEAYFNLSYFRFERPSSSEVGYNSYEEIVEYLVRTTGNILLTTGSNNLEVFTKNLPVSRLICRVLPTLDVIKKCRDLGFKTHQIIGMQGPFSRAFNTLLMKEKSIQYLITKESGQKGGFSDKIEAAKDLAVKVLILKRPKLKIEKVYQTYDEIIKEVERLL